MADHQTLQSSYHDLLPNVPSRTSIYRLGTDLADLGTRIQRLAGPGAPIDNISKATALIAQARAILGDRA
jgi:hypothetical protein